MSYLMLSKVQALRIPLIRIKALQIPSGFSRNLSSASDTFKFSDLSIQTINPNDTQQKPDDGSLIFGKTFSDHMFEVEWTEDNGWGKPLITPLHNLDLHPAAKVLHYAQEVFEGMKAFKHSNGKVHLFRPDLNIARMLLTSERAYLPTFDGQELLKCLKKLVSIDQKWVPDKEGCALYVRPTFIGIDPSLGIGASNKALLYIICSPVGSYFQTGLEAVSLLADPSHVRAWPGGVGNRKMGCNYAPTIKIQKMAEMRGAQQVLWLYGENHQLAEVGTMNIFVYLKNHNGEEELVTPPLDGTILPGVIRQSLLDIARQWNDFKVSERCITMPEILQASSEGRLLEMFGAGTACVVCPVGSIQYMGNTISIPTLESKKALNKKFLTTLLDIQYGRVKSDWSVPIEQ